MNLTKQYLPLIKVKCIEEYESFVINKIYSCCYSKGLDEYRILNTEDNLYYFFTPDTYNRCFKNLKEILKEL